MRSLHLSSLYQLVDFIPLHVAIRYVLDTLDDAPIQNFYVRIHRSTCMLLVFLVAYSRLPYSLLGSFPATTRPRSRTICRFYQVILDLSPILRALSHSPSRKRALESRASYSPLTDFLAMTVMSFSSLPVDVLHHVLAFATAPTLTRLAGTCHAADELVVEEFNFRYNFVLTRYIADPSAFRTILGATSLNIAGSSAALVCSVPTSFIPGDLDVYCDEFGLPVLCDHLIGREFYEVIPERPRSPFHPTTHAREHAERLLPVTVRSVLNYISIFTPS